MTSSVKAVAREPSEGKRGLRSLFKRSYLAIPYGLFLAMFVVFPLFLIVYYAFTDKSGGFTFANFIEFFTTTSYISNVLISIGNACVTTAVCLLIAYPVAYILSRFKSARSYILVLLFVMPMWINFVLRALSLRELLDLLGLLGKTNFLNTVIGMVYDFLPFMILPIYTILSKMQPQLIEAAEDLGANPARVLTRVVLPCSKATVAVILLFYAVGIWNSWFNSMIYLQDRKLYPLQLFLREILVQSTDLEGSADIQSGIGINYIKELLQYCTIIIATVPILIVYPFVQKYFVKGVMMGSLKGE